MLEVKVQCSCGQKYKFDIEPVNGRMPWPIACPVCGADGTASADAVIQQLLAAAPAAGAAPVGAPRPVVVSAPAAAGGASAVGGSGGTPMRIAPPAPGAAGLRISGPAAVPVEPPAPASEGVVPSAPPPPVARPVRAAVATGADAPRSAGKNRFAMGILGALLATAVGVGIWLAVFYGSDWGSRGAIKLFAIVVGIGAGYGARFLSRDEGSNDLGYITAAIAFAGIFAAQYLIAYEQVIGRYKKAVGQVYDFQVEYAKRAVKAVPSGSDAEIRAFLVKEAERDGEKLKPADITAEDLQEFRAEELPQLRDLASGKVTKEAYNKDFGTQELEENSGVKMFIALRGIGIFSLGTMLLAVGAAYKLSATNA